MFLNFKLKSIILFHCSMGFAHLLNVLRFVDVFMFLELHFTNYRSRYSFAETLILVFWMFMY